MNEVSSVPEHAYFEHVIRDAGEQFSLDFDYQAPPEALIRMEIDQRGDFWLSANSEGYLHLARVFAEMGTRPLEDGYHFHMNSEFKQTGGSPEFSFEIDNSRARAAQ